MSHAPWFFEFWTYGYWMLGLTASNSQYHQSVAGFNGPISYAGKSNNAEVKLSRLVYRDQTGVQISYYLGVEGELVEMVREKLAQIQHARDEARILERAGRAPGPRQ